MFPRNRRITNNLLIGLAAGLIGFALNYLPLPFYLKTLVGLAGFLIVAAVAHFVGRRLSGQLAVLEASARRLAGGDLSARPEASRGLTREVRSLTETFTQMAASLEHAWNKQDVLFKQVERGKAEWETTFDSMSDGVFVFDQGGKLVRANLAGARMEGCAVTSLAGKHCCDTLVGLAEGECLVIEALTTGQRVMREGTPHAYDRPLQITVEPLSKDGRIIGATCIARDLSELQQVKEALKGSEKRFRSLVESLPAIVYEVSAQPPYRPIYVSPKIEALGYALEQWLHQPDFWLNVLHPDDRERVAQATEEAMREGRDNEYEYRVIAGDGTIRWLYDRGRFMLDEAGRPAIWQGVIVDITERRRAEEALLASEELRRAVVNGAPIILFAMDRDGVFTLYEGRGLNALGLQRGEVVGRSVFDVYADVPLMLECVRRAMAGEVFTAVTEVAGLGFDSWYSPLHARDGEIIGVIGVATDVTDRRQIEEQLRQSQKMEAVGQLAGGVAHDFNNMLTAINGYSDLSLRKLREGDPLRRNIQEIKKAGERAASLTRQLLAFSRKQVLAPKVLDLNSVVVDMDRMLGRLIGENINLITALDSSLGSVKTDPGQIEQVIMNLVVNARDAMPGGGKLTIETANVRLDDAYARQHPTVTAGTYVMLAVSDTGCGMDAATRARIFEPFFTTKEMGKGTGLGLSTVYGIIQQSGGHISVYSELGRGTTFKIYLPLIEEAAGAAEQLGDSAELQRGSETVLLVEDEEAVRELAREILRMNGYTVLEARHGGEALLLCERQEHPIDLMITDVVMPQMSGRELAERLALSRPRMRVLYMSGYTDGAIMHHDILNQEMAFLQKPFTPDALAHKVREVLGVREYC